MAESAPFSANRFLTSLVVANRKWRPAFLAEVLGLCIGHGDDCRLEVGTFSRQGIRVTFGIWCEFVSPKGADFLRTGLGAVAGGTLRPDQVKKPLTKKMKTIY